MSGMMDLPCHIIGKWWLDANSQNWILVRIATKTEKRRSIEDRLRSGKKTYYHNLPLLVKNMVDMDARLAHKGPIKKILKKQRKFVNDTEVRFTEMFAEPESVAEEE
jgi:hypothetical protein